MVVCKYWKQGNCRNGSACRFEHPSNQGGINNNNNNNRGGFGGGGAFGSINRPERWQLNEDDIRNDLTVTTPKWILSAYGPGKDPPTSLFVDNEFSPEEVRWRFYQAQANGNAEQADKEAIIAWQKAQNDIADASKNIKGIEDFMLQKDKEHPNRYDFCKMDGKVSVDEHANNLKMNSTPGSSMNPFGQNQQSAQPSNPFSKPTIGQSSSPFGQAAANSPFTKPAQPSTFGKPAFGQSASPFGQPAASQPAFGQSGFGQTSTPGNAFGSKPMGATPGFGQTSNLGATASANPFGKPSAAGGFGQPAFGQAAGASTSPFGQAPGATSSPFGQAAAKPSPFGQAGGAAPSPFGAGASSSPFSQPAQAAPTSAFKQDTQSANPFSKPAGFGASPFGQPAQPSTASPFTQNAQPVSQSPFGQNAQQANPNPFTAAQPASSNPFNKPAQPAPSGFAGFGTDPSAARPSPFGQQSQAPPQPANSSPFAQPQPQQTQAQNSIAATNASGPDRSNLTSQPSKPLHYTQTIPWVPASFNTNDKPVTYRGLPVIHDVVNKASANGQLVFDYEKFLYARPDGTGNERIWFPRANADAYVQKLPNALLDFQGEEFEYTDAVKGQYKTLFETGVFQGGKVPLVPPVREWIGYDI